MTELPAYFPQPEPRMRVKISDIAWGVFIGMIAWSLLAFIGFIALSAIFISVP